MKDVFSVTKTIWWFRFRVAIQARGQIFCIIPSGDVDLARQMCELLNKGLLFQASE